MVFFYRVLHVIGEIKGFSYLHAISLTESLLLWALTV